jgi:hypothetical protein
LQKEDGLFLNLSGGPIQTTRLGRFVIGTGKTKKNFAPLRVCVPPTGVTSKKSKFFLLLFCSQKRSASVL